MAYVEFSNNPYNRRVGDCAVRAISKALNKSWEDAYIALCAEGLNQADMPSANNVWGSVLRKSGFKQELLPNICPDCVTVEQFADEHPEGTFVVATPNHVVTVEDGTVFDSWNSSDEVALYFYRKEY